VEFHEGFSEAEYLERLNRANEHGDSPLSAYMHLPFCEKRCLFCGCHVIITKKRDRTEPYLELLKREIELVADRLPDRRGFSQLHLGGGTPTYFTPKQLDDLLGHFLKRFHPVAGAELALEVDPRVTTLEHIDTLAGLGFNRVSMGVQDFTPEVQERIGRVQSREATEQIINRARSHGFHGINVDLIYGLPLQTPDKFEQTVKTVIEMGAERVAAYSFAFVPWMKGHQKKLEESELPDADTKMELFAVARELFLGAGYEPIGMDHFALPDDELSRAKREGRLRRNFQGYTVIPSDDVIGFGISAIGDVRGAYVQNAKKLSRYAEMIEAGKLPLERGVARNLDDELRRNVIHDLMCNFRIDVRRIEAEYGIVFHEHFADDLVELREYEPAGLVEVGDDWITTTPVGELFVRNLAMCFDTYMRAKHLTSEKKTFSRTV
jgi:oxygen-independent coproporphyrinogen-3 oxidase